MKPRLLPHGTFGLKSPLPLTIPEKQEFVLDLGLTSTRWLFLLPHKSLFPKVDQVLVPPGQPVKIPVFNNSASPALLEVGDIALEAVVLDSSDFVVE